MKAMRFLALATTLTLSGLSHAQSLLTAPASDNDKLIGAWHLVSLGEQGADGKVSGVAGLKGTLIYTRDGHMSVQIMYPPSDSALSNDYVLNGYEASFGSYEVNPRAHTVTHRVEGSVTRGLVGKSLARVYKFSDGRLIIQSTNPHEHWSVIWEHD
jgi:hypothetical protein